MRKAVFLDRDGVINKAIVKSGKPFPPESLDAFEFIPGVVSAALALRKAGFVVIVVTNQPDVSTGLQTREVVESMHKKIRDAAICDDIKVCYHTDDDNCGCRKPKPGMLLNAANEWQIDLQRSFIVGDRWRDVAAGKAAGCQTFFIDYKYQEQSAESPDAVVASLQEASRQILQLQFTS
jgi:D-glycero-D-manno-heptose 1,7-bisphosphate phosphatase